ncbi:MAG: hypothetical protein AVDCRST_MAG35-1808, partial [uncultured Quadrisphaera sp.]
EHADHVPERVERGRRGLALRQGPQQRTVDHREHQARRRRRGGRPAAAQHLREQGVELGVV